VSAAQPRRHPSVRPSTDADVRFIHAWLEQQEISGVHGTFLCNWRLTEKAHKEGRLQVYVDPASQAPVAYQWGGLIYPGILEVRNDMRGRGIGRVLVEHCLALAADAGEDMLQIQCKPSNSIPFWEAMGFALIVDKPPHERGDYAYRIMRREWGPWEGGDRPARVTVEWYPEARKWDDTVPPSATQNVDGAWYDDELELNERAQFFEGPFGNNTVVHIVVDGREWYCNKARYSEACDLGVEGCANGYRIDTLYRPTTP
jgi:GNAT superfamily N-acetyltransferase